MLVASACPSLMPARLLLTAVGCGLQLQHAANCHTRRRQRGQLHLRRWVGWGGTAGCAGVHVGGVSGSASTEVSCPGSRVRTPYMPHASVTPASGPPASPSAAGCTKENNLTRGPATLAVLADKHGPSSGKGGRRRSHPPSTPQSLARSRRWWSGNRWSRSQCCAVVAVCCNRSGTRRRALWNAQGGGGYARAHRLWSDPP